MSKRKDFTPKKEMDEARRKKANVKKVVKIKLLRWKTPL